MAKGFMFLNNFHLLNMFLSPNKVICVNSIHVFAFCLNPTKVGLNREKDESIYRNWELEEMQNILQIGGVFMHAYVSIKV